ncbi:MAG: Gfo/Idh/MocA family oxidoreductase [Sumerlaeia bacterium]
MSNQPPVPDLSPSSAEWVPPGKRVRWGIIGCGLIASHAVAPAIRWSKLSVLHRVGSRNRDRARLLANDLGAEGYCGSYEELLADPDIDVVYIGLPNGLHEEWAIRAFEAGKHVLCEKSLSLSLDSTQRIAAAAEKAGLRLMEAYMYRHHPQWDRVRDIVTSGRIGEIRSLRIGLAGLLRDTGDHRWNRVLGGGALYDLTCYGINAARFLFRREPIKVCAMADLTMEEQVDRTSKALLDFGDGRLATVMGSFVLSNHQYCDIEGTDGRIRVEHPFIPGWEQTGIVVEAGIEAQRIVIGGANHFLHQVEHVSLCVLDPSRTLLPGENGIAQAKANQATEEAFRTGRTVAVPK